MSCQLPAPTSANGWRVGVSGGAVLEDLRVVLIVELWSLTQRRKGAKDFFAGSLKMGGANGDELWRPAGQMPAKAKVRLRRAAIRVRAI